MLATAKQWSTPITLSHVLVPPKLKLFRAKRRSVPFTLLDIGCGNHSPSVAKKWFPQCIYTGVDREYYNVNERDKSAMDSFYSVDLDLEGLAKITDTFDVIIASHVIEHLNNGIEIVRQLCQRLNPCGDIYVELPSPRSLHLPSGRYSLNFHDDPTHVRPYPISEIMQIMRAEHVQPVKHGTRRDPVRLSLLPLSVLRETYSLIRYGKLEGPPLWDLLGFANFVYGVKSA